MNIKDLFGIGALQNASFLYIQKADLIGLTPLQNNRAEQLFAAIVKNAQSNFEGFLIDELGDLVIDELGNFISYDNSGFYDLSLKLWRVISLMRNQQYFICHQYLLEEYVKAN